MSKKFSSFAEHQLITENFRKFINEIEPMRPDDEAKEDPIEGFDELDEKGKKDYAEALDYIRKKGYAAALEKAAALDNNDVFKMAVDHWGKIIPAIQSRLEGGGVVDGDQRDFEQEFEGALAEMEYDGLATADHLEQFQWGDVVKI